MRIRNISVAALLLAFVFGVASAAVAPSAQAYNDVDAEFTSMMIPHHHQALVMSDLVPDRSSDDAVRSIASRIRVEQKLEIMSMQGWQGRNDLPVTDPEEAYADLLDQPEMLEQMGMATQAELDELATLSGTSFDVMFLELMIEHHEGAVRMLENLLLNGSDVQLHQMGQDMMSTQRAQIAQMREIHASKT